MKLQDAGPSRGRRRVGAIVALVLLLVAVCLMVVAFQLDTYDARAEALDARLDLSRATLDAGVGSFVSVSSAGDPDAEYSADLAAVHESVASLKTARSRLETIRSDASGLAMPRLVPSAGARRMRGALVARGDALAGYSETLLTSAEFAVSRTEAFEAIASTLDTLQKLADEGVTIEQAEQLVRDVRTSYDAALERMRAGSTASPVLYSNTQVLQRLEELSSALAEIEAAIVARDQARIDAAFQSYVTLVDTDWLARLALNSSDGLRAIDAATLADDDSADEFSAAREDVNAARQMFFLAGLVALIAALVVGARSLVLRDSER